MFNYYNPNPAYTGKKKKWDRGDCMVRAICKYTGMEWVEVFNLLCEAAMSVYDIPNSKLAEEKVMTELGFIRHSYQRGTKRETVERFTKNHKGVSIVVLAGHMVCCVDGNYYDTWDCGNKTAYYYYTKEK